MLDQPIPNNVLENFPKENAVVVLNCRKNPHRLVIVALVRELAFSLVQGFQLIVNVCKTCSRLYFWSCAFNCEL